MTDQEILEQAHTLRRNGQIREAEVLYNQILENDPNNDEYLFGKAMCYVDHDPSKAFNLFKKVLEVNPDVMPAYGNISSIGNQIRNFPEAIEILTEGINRFPDNLELVYQRATLIGNAGNNLEALLVFYSIIENSNLNDPKAFMDHQISTDVALCKTELRNETLQLRLENDPDISKYDGVWMKEYQYKLPSSLFGNENSILEFGKLMGRSINEILDIQPDYIKWCVLNLDNFCVSEEILELLKRKEISIEDCLKANQLKLTVLNQQISKTEFDGDPPDSFRIDDDGNIVF